MRKKKKTAPSTYLIHKCYNRRFYDKVQSRFVTLHGLIRLVTRGEHLKVIDQPTGADVTEAVLILLWIRCETQAPRFTPQQLAELSRAVHQYRLPKAA